MTCNSLLGEDALSREVFTVPLSSSGREHVTCASFSELLSVNYRNPESHTCSWWKQGQSHLSLNLKEIQARSDAPFPDGHQLNHRIQEDLM